MGGKAYSWLRSILPFEPGRRFVAESRVSPGCVIEALDPVKDCLSCLVSCSKSFTVHGFYFERMKEAFSDCIIPADTFATHAAREAVAFQECLKDITGILTSSIEVAQRRSNASSLPYVAL